MKLTNPLATGNFAVLVRLSYCNVVVFSISLCLRMIVVGGRKCDALPGCLVGAGCRGSGHRGGGIIVNDLGRMQIVLGGQLLGANLTNFAVCHITVPLVLACFGLDGTTATRHLMGKLVGDNRFVTVVGEDAC